MPSEIILFYGSYDLGNSLYLPPYSVKPQQEKYLQLFSLVSVKNVKIAAPAKIMGEKDTISPRSVSLEYIIFMANGTSPSETIPPTIRPLGIPITAVLNI